MQQNKGLSSSTIALMVGVALLFDTIQALLTPIGVGWFVPILSYPTFWLWFKLKGFSFLSLKRAPILGIGALIEIIPGIGALPALTATVARVALTAKALQTIAIVPGGRIANAALVNKSINKQASEVRESSSENKPASKTSPSANRSQRSAFPRQLNNWNGVTTRLNDQQNRSLINSTYKGGLEQYNKDTENQTESRIRMQAAQDKLRDSRTAYLKEDSDLNKAA